MCAVKIGDGYIEVEGRPNRSQIRKAAEESGKIGGGAFAGAFGKVASVALKGAMGAALLGVGAQVATLVVQLLGIVPALSSIVSLSALLPAGIIAAVGAVGVLKAAMSGVGDAVKAAFSGDIAAFEKSLKNLSPYARQFAIALRETVGPLKEVQRGLQDAFFSMGLVAEVKKLDDIMNALRGNLTFVASMFGSLAAAAISFTAETESLTVLNGIFAALGNAVASLRVNFGLIATGLRDVITVVLPLFNQLGIAAGSLVGKFGAWLSQIAANGQLQTWINTAIATLQTLGQIVSNIGSIIMSVLGAAQSSGGGFLNVLQSITGTVATFLSSAQGFNTLVSIFNAIAAVAQALMPPILALVSALATSLGPAIVQIAAVLGPVLLQAVNALTPAIGPLVNAFVAIITAVAPMIPIIAQLAAQFGGILAQALTTIAPYLGIILQAFAQLAGPVLSLLGSLLGTLLPPLLQIVTTLVSGLAPILSVIITAFSQWFTALQPVAMLLGTLLVTALQTLLPPILQLVQAVIAILLPAFMQLIPVMMQLYQAFMPLIPVIGQLITAFTPILIMIVQFAATILTQLLPAIVPLIAIIVQLAATLLTNLIPAITPVITVLVKVATTILTIVVTALAWLINNGIRPVVSAIATFIGKIAEVIAAIVRFAGTVGAKFGEIRQTILGVFSSAASWLINAGRDIVEGLINGIKQMASAAVNAAKGVVKNALDGAKSLLGIKSPSTAFAEIGRQTVAGLAQGLMSTGPVDSAMKNLVNATVTPMNTGRRATPSIGPATSSAGREKWNSLNIAKIEVNVSNVTGGNAQQIGEDIADGLLQRLADAAVVR